MLAALLVLAACQPSQVIVSKDGEQQNVISVSGSSEFEVSPDLAVVRVGLETQNKDAKLAQDQNRQVSNQIMDAIRRAGVSKDEIETYNYNVHRVREWDPGVERTVDRGFRVTNSFKIKTKRLEDVGKILDAAAQAGANSVQGISFELSDAREEQARTEALKQAAVNAKEKAKALAGGLGVPLGGLVKVQESSFNIMPYARGGMMEDAMVMKAEAAPTPIEPQSVQINAQVSVSYGIGGLI